MEDKRVLLSVIIPVYNTLDYLPQCLDSVEKQDFSDKEIILVDDGSTDGSAEFCDQYQKSHRHVTVIHKANGGAADSRNVGLSAARGLYIHYIDSDDVLIKDTLYRDFYRDIYPHRPEMAFFRFAEYTQNLTVLDYTQPGFNKEGFFEGDVLREVLTYRYPATLTSPVNKIFSRAFLTDNHLFFTIGIDHEEDEWLPRVISCAQRVWFDNSIIYGVRKGRPGSLSETLDEKTRAAKSCSKIKIAAMGMDYMEQKQLPPQTLSLVAEYYWDYLTDACVACCQLQSRKYKYQIYAALRDNKRFFDSGRYLTSKNRRALAIMFKTLGIRATVKTVGVRYGGKR